MAAAGRIRSGVPLLSRLLKSDSLSTQRSVIHRAVLCPVSTASEVSRNYSSVSGKKEDKIKVPLALFGGSGNYASALFLAAKKANALETVESEILALVESMKKSPTFHQFTKDLSLPAPTRIEALKDICSNAKFSDITKNFLLVLADNGRLGQVDHIASRFVELTMADRGEVKAIVTTVIVSFYRKLQMIHNHR
uniref:ATP synthase subunit O n=1 Tax=Rhizophora mucronata TaxID=61149 RepID=A0A2P2KHX2_RHIMU